MTYQRLAMRQPTILARPWMAQEATESSMKIRTMKMASVMTTTHEELRTSLRFGHTTRLSSAWTSLKYRLSRMKMVGLAALALAWAISSDRPLGPRRYR